MKQEAKSQLKQIIGAYDEKLAEAERIDAANRAAQAAFPERFATLRSQVVAPALQEIAEMLNDKGHEASLKEQEESSSAVGGVRSAAVSLRIVPKPFAKKSAEGNPVTIEITFSANRAARKVTVSSTNTMIGHSGSVGKRGEYEVDAVTADVVASHVIQTLAEAFGSAK
jgi:vancomycin resistance protein YoaR